MEMTYPTRRAVKCTGASQRQIIDWCDRGLVMPVVDAAGHGSRREFSTGNLLEIRLLKHLTDGGLSHRQAGLLVQYAKSILGTVLLGDAYYVHWKGRGKKEDTIADLRKFLTRFRKQEHIEPGLSTLGAGVRKLLEQESRLFTQIWTMVRDDGGGDSPPDMESIFSPFCQYVRMLQANRTQQGFCLLLNDHSSLYFAVSTTETVGLVSLAGEPALTTVPRTETENYRVQLRINLGTVCEDLIDSLQSTAEG
jgi:DNA-binding transcriptional MerR regulator